MRSDATAGAFTLAHARRQTSLLERPDETVGPADRGLRQSKWEPFRVRCGAVCAPAMAALGDLKLIMADVTSTRTPRPAMSRLLSLGGRSLWAVSRTV
ncbi:hypothetical protein MRX96_013008 [Rhipicephalus microplus]